MSKKNIKLIKKYSQWLHLKWPSGRVEKLPQVNSDGTCNVAGVYIVGDLAGVPLLKFSSDTGSRAVKDIARKIKSNEIQRTELDLIIIGAGISGMAAALEAQTLDLNFKIIEANNAFSTIENFPVKKPIFTYPMEMIPSGNLQFTTDIKENLLNEVTKATKDITVNFGKVNKVSRKKDVLETVLENGEILTSTFVIVAIGRSGNFRKLGVPGEDSKNVFNRLHDPKEFKDKKVLVIGGGDSALETAIATAECGADVTISYRKKEFSRAKPENIDRLSEVENIELVMESTVKKIEPNSVEIKLTKSELKKIKNDVVFSMIGREAPLEFFRRSGIKISGEFGKKEWISFSIFFMFCTMLYNWKAGAALTEVFKSSGWFPFNIPILLSSWLNDSTSLAYVVAQSLGKPGFYYTFAYCACVIIFGVKRILLRKTSYVKVQTYSLMLIQFIPLFLLPYIILPWMGNNGLFEIGTLGGTIADQLFESYDTIGHDRAYWRAFGFILAWPLFIYNVFNHEPMWVWLLISCVQTCVIIPLIVWKWGKGAYCGWICSCGALAETLGDQHRQKMVHGPKWNKVNLLGQVILGIAFLLLGLRIVSWLLPSSISFKYTLESIYYWIFVNGKILGVQTNYRWVVDTFLAGIVGVGCYFWFSGRVWCRFACPLAALMHIYARFSKFRIFSDKKKCISCNVCTSVCHQGIDIMNFANKGLPMEDPECVRCSACVQSCPTGVLQFGEIDKATGEILRLDRLSALTVVD